MQLSPLCLVFAAGLTTLGVGQAVLPTAHAQASDNRQAATPLYQVAVKKLHTAHTKGSLETIGEIVNTGSGTLTYTSVVLVFKTADGTEAASVPAYLTTGPVGPGQSAEFRAASPERTYASVSVRLRESGHPVTVEPAQNPDKRRTTVR